MSHTYGKRAGIPAPRVEAEEMVPLARLMTGLAQALPGRGSWNLGPRLKKTNATIIGGALGAQACLVLVTMALPGSTSVAHGSHVKHARHHVAVIADPTPADRPDAAVVAAETAAMGAAAPVLPPATTAPLPAPPAVAVSPTLRPHEVFGFAPYWTLPSSGGFDVADLSTVAYFGLDAAGDGSVATSGAGWNGYQSQALANLISRAHAASDRVVLSVECFDQPSLDRLAADPKADQTLADNIIRDVQAKALDGANLDFEGTGSADRAGIARLMGYLGNRLHAVDPHWQVTVDTYGGSASDPNGFFDVRSMAPAVDAFFVMAYDMYRSGTASPNAPLSGTDPSDADVLAGYRAAVPAAKVVLGVPFYGYQWQTKTNAPEAAAVSGPMPVAYAQARTITNVYWDQSAHVPWSEYQDAGGHWFEVYFDNPQSVALKAQLANADGVAGVGIWALGMDGNDPAMMAALLGHARAVKGYATGPSRVSASPGPNGASPSSTSTTSTTSTTSPPLLPSATPTTSPKPTPSSSTTTTTTTTTPSQSPPVTRPKQPSSPLPTVPGGL